MLEFEQSELEVIFARWLLANPMHTTLFGRSVNLHTKETPVLEYAKFMAESVIEAVTWNDQNPLVP